MAARVAGRRGEALRSRPRRARDLNRTLTTIFAPDDIYRIDHFLGEETLLNVLYLRMANSLIEALFNRRHVTRVQITMAEDFGVEDRGSFYDGTGCPRRRREPRVPAPVSARHDPPAPHAPTFRQTQTDLFEAMRPLDPADLVRGQYAATARFRVFVPTRTSRRSSPCGSSSTRPAGRAPFLIRAGMPARDGDRGDRRVRRPALERFPATALAGGADPSSIPFPSRRGSGPVAPHADPGRTPPTQIKELVLARHEPRRNTVRAPSGSLHRRQVDPLRPPGHGRGLLADRRARADGA